MSLPIRGARIEKETNHAKQNWMGRSPCGERELKKQGCHAKDAKA